jgi:hypothetical protein
MFRDGTSLRTTDCHNFVLNHGALGDMITSLPPLIYARRLTNSALKLKVWVAVWQVELVTHLLAPYGEFEVLDIAGFPLERLKRGDMGEKWAGGQVSMNCAAFNHETRNRRHMVDFAFGTLIDSAPDNMNDRNYPVMAPLGPRTIDGDYIVIPVNATSETTMFRAKVMRPIIEWALGAGYKVVLLGTKVSKVQVVGANGPRPIKVLSEDYILPISLIEQCTDLREQTTLLQARDICGYSKGVVGVDGGTIHLAGTTMCPIVYGVTRVRPEHRFVARLGSPHFNIRYVAPRELECAGCQSRWVLTHWSFDECAYGDNKCTYQLHHDDFINSLKELHNHG